jgi:phage-related protein
MAAKGITLPIVFKSDNKGIKDAQSSLSGLSSGIGKAFAGIGIAAGVAGAAAAGLVASSVKAFSELEQNLGGSEAVFGEFAQSLQDKGAEAYRNLGVSQSEYLATANKMGALFQGSGIEQEDALNMTTDAMQRAADMASVMGIDMGVAMDSVAGAAKGNFTMMDNLGVAMNATSIEAYAASQGITGFSFATASSAEKADMAMKMFLDNTSQYAGNFAKEATETISGSMGMLRAATSSLVAGLGDANADASLLAGNVVEAFEAVIKNVVPIVENIAAALPEALGAMVDSVGPLIGSIGGVIIGLVPTILDAAVQLADALLRGIADTLPALMTMLPGVILSMVDSLVTLLPVLIKAGTESVVALSDGISNTMPTLIPTLVDGLLVAVDAIISALPMLLEAGLQIVMGLAEGIITALPTLIEALPAIIDSIMTFLIGTLPVLIETGLSLFMALVGALPQIIDGIVGVLPEIIGGLISAILGSLPLLISAGIDLFFALVGALPEIIVGIVSAVPQIITAIQVAVLESMPQLIVAGIQLFLALIAALPVIIVEIVSAIPPIIVAIVQAIIESIPQLIAAGSELIRGLWQGIKDMEGWLRDKISGFFGGVVDDIKNFFGISSPSKVFAEMGKNLGQGMAQGIVASTKDVEKAMGGMMAVSSGTLPSMNASVNMSTSGSMGMGGGGSGSGQTFRSGGEKQVYNITVNAGMGSDGKRIGEQIIREIKRYERQSGPVFVSA